MPLYAARMQELQRDDRGRVEVRCIMQVPLPRERVWQVLADTQHINQLIYRLDPMRALKVSAKGVLVRGGYGFAGPEYDELPLEFRAPEQYRCVREFHGGLFVRNEVECTFGSTPDGGTKVEYVNVMLTRPSPWFWWVRFGFSVSVRRSLQKLERLLAAQVPEGALRWPFQNPTAGAVLARARPFADLLATANPAQAPLIETLVQHLAEALDDDVARMRPYELAGRWGASRDDVLALFLRGTQAGLLQLSWDLLCPSCESAPVGVPSLSQIPAQGHCEACDVTWRTAFERNVEATFRPTPAVREVANAIFCFGSPSRTPHWLAQVLVQAGESRVLEASLGAGRYRVQGAGVDGHTLIDVRDGGASEVEVRVGTGADGRGALPEAADTLAAGSVRIALVNDDVQPRRLQLAYRDFARASATAADVTALGLYPDLFGGEVLAPGQHIRVGRTAILFTDLVGSTEMYESIGDAEAYGLVWRHFAVLEEAIAAHGGRVVKTIGDAVMASFPRAIDAVRAAWSSVEGVAAMQGPKGEPAGLALKAGVHEGPCLAVNANEVSDFFGRTVNVAARVQGLAGAGELVVSAAALETAEVEAYLRELVDGGAHMVTERCAVKGVAGDLEVRRVRRQAAAPVLRALGT
jgi:adenylate cyclase